MKKSLLGLMGMTFVFAALFSMNLFAANAGYDKGFYIASDDGDYKIKTNIQLMPQFQFVHVEGGPNDNATTFTMRKARVIFKGHAFNPDVTFKFQLEAVGGGVTASVEGRGLGGPNLRDAWINYAHSDGFQIKFGQFKTPFNREELTSSSKLQFVDRSINNEVFTHGRDLGVDLHGMLADDQFGYDIYVQNEGLNRNTTNPNQEILGGIRLLWNALGNHGYSQSDVKDSDEHQLSFAIGGNINFPAVAGGDDPTIIGATGDIAWKYRGFSFHGEGNYFRNQTAKTNLIGALGQIGYFFVPETFEAALRGAVVIPKGAGAGTNGYETGMSLNYFFYGHDLKLQADYAILWNSAVAIGGAQNAANYIGTAGGLPGFVQNENDHRGRVQVQLYF